MEEPKYFPPADPNLYSKLTNVLRAIELSTIGLKPGTVNRIRDSLSPLLDEKEVIHILEISLKLGLAIVDEDSKGYFITDDGRRVLVIGI